MNSGNISGILLLKLQFNPNRQLIAATFFGAAKLELLVPNSINTFLGDPLRVSVYAWAMECNSHSHNDITFLAIYLYVKFFSPSTIPLVVPKVIRCSIRRSSMPP